MTRLLLKKRRIPFAHFLMRAFGVSFLALLSILALAQSQATAAEPRFRPALIGNGPKALVNVINTKRLVEKGQRDGLLMFSCYVDRSGHGWNHTIYRETPGSKLLREELERVLWGCRFIPPIYNRERTDVWFTGTVIFFVTGGKPHLRVYANQSHDDIEKGNDFIAPQVVANTPDWVGSGYDLAAQKARVYQQNGAIQLSATVDANGNQRDLRVISEDPPGFGLGAVTRNTFAKAKYIPGFRNGRPADCTFDFPVFFLTRRGGPHG